MSSILFTPAQHEAIRTVDRSVLVSAAAGSGKTAVLAERCAYLVCDALPPHRCDIDQLLVLTFTDAAAAEMRTRITQAILDRSARAPEDARLQIQGRAVGAAQISTLHSFCLWLTRRWFDDVGVDPAAVVLDEHDAELMRIQALDQVMEAGYAEGGPRGEAFRDLVEHYGLGDDGPIRSFVLDLDAFLRSLPEPAEWMGMARARCTSGRQEALERYLALLADELDRQQEFCEVLLRRVPHPGEMAAYYVDKIREYATNLEAWRSLLGRVGRESFDAVREAILSLDLATRSAPRKKKDTPPYEIEQRDQARELLEQIRDDAFKKRLQRRFVLFTADELLEGMQRTGPFVHAVFELIDDLQARYQEKKRAVASLDYSDLERCAYQLLKVVPGAVTIQADMQRRFTHVLVDEFQDINPLQAAILEAVSREADADRPANLFVVGDIKQSIYRFRLAEPSLFLRRTERLAGAANPRGRSILLDANFRSVPTIIEGVNALFGLLMHGSLGGVEYNAGHALRATRETPTASSTAIEVHILDRARGTATEDAPEDEQGERTQRYVNTGDPVEWETIEREAFLIGSQIRRLIDESARGATAAKLTYGDIAILLRAAAHTAAPVASVLRRMGIPAHTDAGDGLLQAREVADVLALLHLLDNPQQDIFLAAVMRSGVAGVRFNEDELLSLRQVHRDGAFHEAVRGAVRPDDDSDFGSRLHDFFTYLARYREDFRRRPLADALGKLYAETGYPAYVAGLPNGAQRRANLHKLHDYARAFGRFHKQGLYRFLRFLEGMEHDRRDWSVAATGPSAGQAVRIMSIHRSKGLEFPVVFVADLGRQFNLSDVRRRMIFEREVGVGLRVVDRARMIEYPSLLHHFAAERSIDQSLGEELRVLYVALTRARDRLFLVGSMDSEQVRAGRRMWSGQDAIDPLTLMSARHPLDWLVPAMASLEPDIADWSASPEESVGNVSLFRVHLHDAASMSGWRMDSTAGDPNSKTLNSLVARLEALPDDEPRLANSLEVQDVVDRLDFIYPRLAVASVRAVMGVSEAKRRLEFVPESEERTHDPPRQRPISEPTFTDLLDAQTTSATLAGRVTHSLLEHLDFGGANEEKDIARQLENLVIRRLISPEEAGRVDVGAVAWFVQTSFGKRIRSQIHAYHREYMFIMTVPASTFDPQLSAFEGEEVLVRGIVDGLLVHEEYVELIDFKTDRVSGVDLDRRVEEYRVQLDWYARALQRIWKKPVPVEHRHLVFLHPRVVVPSTPASLHSLLGME